MKPLARCRLYTFIDTGYLHGRDPTEIARQLCEGGSDLIQLRAKNSTPDEIRRMAESITPVLRQANVGLVINDYYDIAQEVGADLCHLGQEDFLDNNVLGRAERCDALNISVSQDLAEKIVGISTGRSAPLIGLSTHAPAQAERALAANPAYIAIGPVYATGTKPGAKPVTLEYVRWAASHVTIPWFAIGGINLENLDNVLAAGVRRICVVSAILNTENVAKACLEFRNRLGSPS